MGTEGRAASQNVLGAELCSTNNHCVLRVIISRIRAEGYRYRYIYIYFFLISTDQVSPLLRTSSARSSHLSDLISLSQCTTLSYLWFASATWVSFLFLEQSKYAAISRPLCLGFLLGMQKTLHFLFQWWESHEEDFEARSGISHVHNHCLM